MKILANSLAARDIAHLVHPQTNLQRHLEQGPAIVDHASGVWLYDDEGNALLDSMSGLWCAPLGYAPERLARAAYEQMHDRKVEALLREIEVIRRDAVLHQTSKQQLSPVLLDVAVQARVERQRELDQTMIEERGSNFE